MKYSTKAGLPPGSLIHIGSQKSEKVSVTTFIFTETEFKEFVSDDIQKLKEQSGLDTVTWINIDGLHDTKLIGKIGEVYDLHHLLLEDILNTNHMPKTEEHEEYGFLTLKMMNYDDKNKAIVSEQVSFIFGHNYVLSFQEKKGDVFDPIRDRIRNMKGKVRQRGADYLLYVLIDTVVDNYFYILEQLGEQVEDMEDEVMINPSDSFLIEIQYLKRQLIALRRSVYPLRESLNVLTKTDTVFMSKKTSRYLKDVQDHVLQIIDSIETQRDIVGSLMDVYLSSLSHKMNSVMKVLTIIATIFIPLTFIAGIYGMNFNYMPELQWKYGYFFIMGIMGVILGLMIYYFKKKEWL